MRPDADGRMGGVFEDPDAWPAPGHEGATSVNHAQPPKRLSVGAEALSGAHETTNGHDGDVVRFQLGLVYSIFD